MKVAVLTYPLNNNFGNLLQAWALKTYFEKNGHQVKVFYRKNKFSRSSFLINRGKYFIRKCLNMPTYHQTSPKEEIRYSANTNKFISENINARVCYSTQELYDELRNFDTVVLGSDQIWRPKFLGNLYPDYFLKGYCKPKNQHISSYAASLGVDVWEFSQEETTVAKEALQIFDKISVRESSAERLLKTNLNLSSQSVLDPTLLLDMEDYDNLLTHSAFDRAKHKDIFCYLLDMTPEIRGKIENWARLKNLTVNFIQDYFNIGKKSVYPDIRTWLDCIKSSKYIITNSFHGTVFSIIYNKPFIALTHNERGVARLANLFDTFCIEQTPIDIGQLTKDLDFPTSTYKSLSPTLIKEQEKAFSFLFENI